MAEKRKAFTLPEDLIEELSKKPNASEYVRKALELAKEMEEKGLVRMDGDKPFMSAKVEKKPEKKPVLDGGLTVVTLGDLRRMAAEEKAEDDVDVEEDDSEDIEVDRPIHRDIPSFVKWHRFRVPVGNVFTYGVYKLKEEYWPATAERPLHRYSPHSMYYHMAMSRLWWCPPDKIEYVRELARPFTDCGAFKFHVAKDDDTYQGMYPGVIKTPREERRPNGYFTASTKMVVAFVGDRLVWLTLEDPEKAEEILAERSDIPCAIQADALRYSEDEAYRRVFDLANHYFIEYFWHGTPVAVGVSRKAEKEILEELYDV